MTMSEHEAQRRVLVAAVGEPRMYLRKNAMWPKSDYIPRMNGTRITDVIQRVARETGFTVPMLVGNQRTKELAVARQYAYWLAARETGASISSIARAFGDRDHTTVAHGIRQHEKRLKSAPKVIPGIISNTQMNYSLHSKCADNS
jgi:chromosomal replication initiator protein